MGNFMDTYYNLLYKARTALHFFGSSCRSKALILMDDDIVIRHPAIFKNNIGEFQIQWKLEMRDSEIRDKVPYLTRNRKMANKGLFKSP